MTFTFPAQGNGKQLQGNGLRAHFCTVGGYEISFDLTVMIM